MNTRFYQYYNYYINHNGKDAKVISTDILPKNQYKYGQLKYVTIYGVLVIGTLYGIRKFRGRSLF